MPQPEQSFSCDGTDSRGVELMNDELQWNLLVEQAAGATHARAVLTLSRERQPINNRLSGERPVCRERQPRWQSAISKVELETQEAEDLKGERTSLRRRGMEAGRARGDIRAGLRARGRQTV